MVNNNFANSTIGWMAIASGIAAILAIVFLGLMATVNIFFGTIKDILNSVLAILIAVLAWMLYAQHHAKSPLMSQVALGLAVLGTLLAVVGSILVIFKFTGFVLAGWYTGFGYALLGLWLAAFCYSMLGSNIYPNKLIVLGIITGVAMAMGIYPNLEHWLGNVYVLPEYRNQGVGSQITEVTVGTAKQLGVKTLYLYTRDQERFYQRLGWGIMEQTEYRGRKAFVMSRALG